MTHHSKRFKRGAEDNERGAIVMEATISLSVFIFAIFMLLSIVNMCFVQAKIGSALASSAKELSQYSFLYYKFSLDKAQAKMNTANASSRATANQTIDGVATVLGAINDSAESLEAGSFGEIAGAAGTMGTTVESLGTLYKNELEDPKAFIIGMAKLAGEEVLETGKNKLGQVLARALMQKNLVESKADTADKFLRRYKVMGGLDGLDFDGSSLMAYGKSDEIQLVVAYKIEVVRLLNFDFHFTITQCAKTDAWGNGISAIRMARTILDASGSSVWDLPAWERGKSITRMEKAKIRYTADTGFDGYSKAENQFIQITSMDGASYKNANNIQKRLLDTYNKMYKQVSALGETIKVKDRENANQVTELASPELTRTYKIILVVPDNADMALVKGAASKFESTQRAQGRSVTVEVKTGYGVPTEKNNDATGSADSGDSGSGGSSSGGGADSSNSADSGAGAS